MKLKIILIALFSLYFLKSNAQSKTTEIWLLDISKQNEKVVAGTPERLTDNDYYDNQPCFSKDGGLLWYVSMPDTIQTDIFEYNLRKKLTRQITNTPESEFQPQPIPFEKFKLSVVRIDDDKAQRFYSIQFDGSEPEPLMPNEDSVAYYTWMNDTTVGAYMLNGGNGVLHQFDMKPQQSIILMTGGFGRCLARIPGTDNLSYIQKSSDGKYLLMDYKMATEERVPLVEMMPGVEDYCWAPDGKVFAGDKAKLYYIDTTLDEPKWVLVADLAKTVGTFYRMAMSPKGDKIALVSYKGERP